MNVCIPTVGASPHLSRLIETLQADDAVKRIDLFVNEHDALPVVAGQLTDHERVAFHHAEPKTIYPAWNWAIRQARSDGQLLAILNDDISLPPDPITAALEYWAGHSDVAVLGFDHTGTVPAGRLHFCRGTIRHHGIPGFAFLVDPDKVTEVDTQFRWWFGDDDLFFNAEKHGHRLARCSVPVQHEAETTASTRTWTHTIRFQDQERFKSKWGDR